MGAWSHESFGNDDACDWVGTLEQHNDSAFLETTFDTLLALGDDYIEAPEASESIAAAETVARLRGNYGIQDAYSENVDAWVKRVQFQPSKNLIEKARRALDRIMMEPSELMELWGESDESSAWRAAVEDLKLRVGT